MKLQHCHELKWINWPNWMNWLKWAMIWSGGWIKAGFLCKWYANDMQMRWPLPHRGRCCCVLFDLLIIFFDNFRWCTTFISMKYQTDGPWRAPSFAYDWPIDMQMSSESQYDWRANGNAVWRHFFFFFFPLLFEFSEHWTISPQIQ